MESNQIVYSVPDNLMGAIVNILAKVPSEVGADVYVALRALVTEQVKAAEEVKKAPAEKPVKK